MDLKAFVQTLNTKQLSELSTLISKHREKLYSEKLKDLLSTETVKCIKVNLLGFAENTYSSEYEESFGLKFSTAGPNPNSFSIYIRYANYELRESHPFGYSTSISNRSTHLDLDNDLIDMSLPDHVRLQSLVKSKVEVERVFSERSRGMRTALTSIYSEFRHFGFDHC